MGPVLSTTVEGSPWGQPPLRAHLKFSFGLDPGPGMNGISTIPLNSVIPHCRCEDPAPVVLKSKNLPSLPEFIWTAVLDGAACDSARRLA